MLALKLLVLVSALCVHAAPKRHRAPFELPFHTEGPRIVSSSGQKVQLVGTNWPGHQENMIPEGLQYASIRDIVTRIKNFKLNVVRLTFAIQLVDEIYSKGFDTPLKDAIIGGLGTTYGPGVLSQILANNPQFTEDTTRLEVYDAVAAELSAQGIYVHLDNHMSKAFWCCGGGDGNAWFGDTDFNVTRWLRGWEYMAGHAKSWTSFSSVGLRNELRQADNGRGEPYDWYTWYVHMTDAAKVVHRVAPDALIFFSGLNYDVTVAPLVRGQTLNGTAGTSTAGKTAFFNPNSFDFKDKIVLEVHKYDFEKTQVTCDNFESQLMGAGYLAVNANDAATKFTYPVLLTEYGFLQDATYWNSTTYSKCLIQFFAKWKPSGWMQWEIGGSYYVRTWKGGSFIDDEESWGLLNHYWNGTRSQEAIDNSLLKLVDATLG